MPSRLRIACLHVIEIRDAGQRCVVIEHPLGDPRADRQRGRRVVDPRRPVNLVVGRLRHVRVPGDAHVIQQVARSRDAAGRRQQRDRTDPAQNPLAPDRFAPKPADEVIVIHARADVPVGRERFRHARGDALGLREVVDPLAATDEVTACPDIVPRDLDAVGQMDRGRGDGALYRGLAPAQHAVAERTDFGRIDPQNIIKVIHARRRGRVVERRPAERAGDDAGPRRRVGCIAIDVIGQRPGEWIPRQRHAIRQVGRSGQAGRRPQRGRRLVEHDIVDPHPVAGQIVVGIGDKLELHVTQLVSKDIAQSRNIAQIDGEVLIRRQTRRDVVPVLRLIAVDQDVKQIAGRAVPRVGIEVIPELERSRGGVGQAEGTERQRGHEVGRIGIDLGVAAQAAAGGAPQRAQPAVLAQIVEPPVRVVRGRDIPPGRQRVAHFKRVVEDPELPLRQLDRLGVAQRLRNHRPGRGRVQRRIARLQAGRPGGLAPGVQREIHACGLHRDVGNARAVEPGFPHPPAERPGAQQPLRCEIRQVGHDRHRQPGVELIPRDAMIVRPVAPQIGADDHRARIQRVDEDRRDRQLSRQVAGLVCPCLAAIGRKVDPPVGRVLALAVIRIAEPDPVILRGVALDPAEDSLARRVQLARFADRAAAVADVHPQQARHVGAQRLIETVGRHVDLPIAQSAR
ncbi:MAG: hypothetical protein BWZ08_01915 [candidate division BRC1 bacterium ADurb.BinA292]|nr:MAG: hypothetical protein BWZ08_01915 [candidate division BRC1 bacterium ADurb.BinA292]